MDKEKLQNKLQTLAEMAIEMQAKTADFPAYTKNKSMDEKR